ncbi:NAD(P)-dependent alcohol dehydrogenase [Arthrobacter sp. CAN_C5]|uniref:NAD(P)-dependent alcohol dehydrogenase n=1 Tax=Arthrobacter sp. CAN_C5 TaxID=2760706 RepID=UPI001AE692DD|nr:NAD(P)-dependent alcohol dehydrogenase [Arthrobacter sp. CAN_C5]MBP2215091.1 NADPH:quinone reductase-like Zn-dependent oxidoreductase [Arthrobacter sp. CAN_C5]
MKAMTYSRYGAPDVLELDDLPQPVPKENEVLVRNHASVVSAADAQARAADPAIARLHFGLIKPKWPVLGATFSGVVDSVGSAVTRFERGDAVSGVNVAGFGAHAEYILVPQDGVVTTTPSGLTHEQTVAVFDGSLTALPFLRDHAQLRRGQSILINGASGAVGTAAVQLAKYYGATVTAVCSAANAALVRSLGADAVIDYHRADFTTAEDTYDVIFDAVAKSSFRRSRGALKKPGIYLTTVPSPAILAQMLWTSRFGSRKAKIAFTGLAQPAAMTADLKFIAGLAESGHYVPVIDTVDLLEDAAAAHRRVSSGRKAGSAVLAIHPAGKLPS